MQDAHLAETHQSLRPIRPEHHQRQRQDQQFEGSMSIGYLDGGTTESHRETRRQRLHLQIRDDKLHNGKRIGAHGIPHHLKNGGDFGFLEGIPENRVDRTPTNTAHTAQYSLFTCAERIARAWLKNCSVIVVRLKRIRHLPCTTSTSSSSFTFPSTITPVHAKQRDNTDQSKSNAIKNQDAR